MYIKLCINQYITWVHKHIHMYTHRSSTQNQSTCSSSLLFLCLRATPSSSEQETEGPIPQQPVISIPSSEASMYACGIACNTSLLREASLHNKFLCFSFSFFLFCLFLISLFCFLLPSHTFCLCDFHTLIRFAEAHRSY